jgi:hypothetical protein
MFSRTLKIIMPYSLIKPGLLSLVLFLLFFQTVKASGPDTTKPLLKAIEVRDNSSLFGESFYRIFHMGSFIVYQSQYQFDSSVTRLKFDSALKLESPQLESQFSEKRYRFFVFHRDSSFGYSYDAHAKREAGIRLQVDSVAKGIIGFNSFEKLLIKKPDSIIWNADKTELKEVYLQKPSEDTPAVQISFYYSGRLNNLFASLNTVLDSAKKMKFYKYEYVISEFYNKEQQTLCPAIYMSCEMKEYAVARPEEITTYIEIYRKTTGIKPD